MLSDELRNLQVQVRWYREAGLLDSIGHLIDERLGGCADDAVQLERQTMPPAARLDIKNISSYGANVVALRRAGGQR